MGKFVLVSCDGDGSGQINVELTPGNSYRVGSSTRCDVTVSKSDVSRSHAVLRLTEDGTLRLTDIGSKNGTFVGGRRVHDVDLRTGQEFSISTARLMVVEMSSDSYLALRSEGESEAHEPEETAQHRDPSTFEDGVRLLEETAEAVRSGRCNGLLRWITQRFRLAGMALLFRDGGELSVVQAEGELVSCLRQEPFLEEMAQLVTGEPGTARPVVLCGRSLLSLGVEPGHVLLIDPGDGPSLETRELRGIRAACLAVTVVPAGATLRIGGEDLGGLGSMSLDDAVEAVERAMVNAAVSRAGDDRGRAAEQLGISRPRLSKKLRRFGLGDGEEE